MATLETRDGATIHYKVIGSGAPVILIHGWPLTGDMWEYQTVALVEAGFQVITYDRRGFGHSSHPATGYDYDIFADDLADLIEKLDAPQVALVGFSMGGGEIARYLTRHGAAKVSRAVLVSSVVPYLLKTDDNPDGADGSVFEEMKAQIREDRFAFLQSFAKSFYGVGFISKPVSPGILDWSFQLAVMASPIGTAACVDAFGYTDFRADLASFTIPTLVIHGAADATVPIKPTGQAAAHGIAGAEFIEYEGEPHGLFATAPDRLNADLVTFLRG